MAADLHAAFEAARYRVFLNETSHVLCIAAPCPEPIVAWLREAVGPTGAWLITAVNPRAERLDAERNTARERLLRDWATRRATAWLEAVNEDPNGRWPDEPGLLAAGVDESEVRALARRFGQVAVVYCAVERPAELVWINSAVG